VYNGLVQLRDRSALELEYVSQTLKNSIQNSLPSKTQSLKQLSTVKYICKESVCNR
jgi:hypothetical protein